MRNPGRQEWIGYGSVRHLADFLAEHRPRRVFLVTGGESFQQSGAQDALEEICSPYEVVRFCGFRQNPRVEDVRKGVAEFCNSACDLIVAVGGGSVIDTAKLVNVFSANDGKIEAYLEGGREIEKKGKPMVALPTTAGTGSEATHFAALYQGEVKHSVAHPGMLPDAAIVDPQFTLTLPPRLTAVTGMDALSQAVESYWSVHATPETQKDAREALRAIVSSLEQAVRSPTREAREKMAYGAHLAGRAINVTKTTAPHALSYTMTIQFGIPHGHAVALTIGQFFEYNAGVNDSDAADPRGAAYVRKTLQEINEMLGCASAAESNRKLKALMKRIGLEASLSRLGIATERERRRIIETVNVERLENNPRRVTRAALETIIQKIA